MDEKIQATVKTLNERLRETNTTPYTLDIAEPGSLKLLEKSARYMSHEMFENLVANIKKDRGLSSLPLCYRRPDGSLLVLSGNHATFAYLAAIGSADRLVGPHEAVLDFCDVRDGRRWTIRPNPGPVGWWVFAPSRRVPDTRPSDYLAILALVGPQGVRRIDQAIG